NTPHVIVVVVPLTRPEVYILYHVGLGEGGSGCGQVLHLGCEVGVTAEAGSIMLHVDINGGFWQIHTVDSAVKFLPKRLQQRLKTLSHGLIPMHRNPALCRRLLLAWSVDLGGQAAHILRLGQEISRHV